MLHTCICKILEHRKPLYSNLFDFYETRSKKEAVLKVAAAKICRSRLKPAQFSGKPAVGSRTFKALYINFSCSYIYYIFTHLQKKKFQSFV